MKRLLALLCLMLYLNGATWQLFTLACFYANQQTIIRTLCENRARPKLHCNGHCVLAKKLKAAEADQDANAPLDLTRLHDHAPTNPATPIASGLLAASQQLPMPEQDATERSLRPIWQPPQA